MEMEANGAEMFIECLRDYCVCVGGFVFALGRL